MAKKRPGSRDLSRVLSGLITLAASAVSLRLAGRERRAERLADENTRLYRTQREISEILQHALLPKALPAIAGVDLAARYVPGVRGIDVGGDWYGVVPVDDHRFVVHVGDVSGRGLPAAALMGSLRFTIRALASLGLDPPSILANASRELDFQADGHFATALIAIADTEAMTLTVASAGHPPALLVNDGQAEFLAAPPGPPLGVGKNNYRSATFPVRRGATLLIYTDGLVEHRGESIERGLERLAKEACRPFYSLEDLVTRVVAELPDPSADDDVALVGVSWTN